MTKSWAPEVIADSTGKWVGNAMRFARAEAEANVSALKNRWFAVIETRVVESDDPVNYRWVDGKGVADQRGRPDRRSHPARRSGRARQIEHHGSTRRRIRGLHGRAVAATRSEAEALMKRVLNTIAIAVVLTFLMPSLSWACSDHKRKPVKCTSYTNINGTTKSTCR
ncbi:hypothetical protein [Bradyrhizobium elkanii]|uniref:hypothetical protein n=1 Tax=Bradyrhizobium elkanii TaxID=29448 RepID=UPI0004BAA6D2|nr:hypothetical protein [Bradyrhizobium elkanii]WLA79537.1 hypothetical protein QNJ99_29570 [Bradyrhizobium elkanii]